MVGETKNVQRGISCGFYKGRRISLNDVAVHEKITFRRMLFVKLLYSS